LSLLEKIIIFLWKCIGARYIDFLISQYIFHEKINICEKKLGKGQMIGTHRAIFSSNNAKLRSPWKNWLCFRQGLQETLETLALLKTQNYNHHENSSTRGMLKSCWHWWQWIASGNAPNFCSAIWFLNSSVPFFW
jgi:hypothetical protein